jgi:hypothetical protein
MLLILQLTEQVLLQQAARITTVGFVAMLLQLQSASSANPDLFTASHSWFVLILQLSRRESLGLLPLPVLEVPPPVLTELTPLT